MNSLRRTACAIVLLALAACERPPTDPAEGVLADHRYRNPFFGLDLPLPSDWTITAGQAAAKSLEAAAEAAERAVPEVTRSKLSQTTVLLRATAPQRGNAPPSSLVVAIEPKPDAQSQDADAAYLERVAATFKNLGTSWEKNGPIVPVTIGGLEFRQLDLALTAKDSRLRLRYIASLIHGHALVLILNTADEAEMKRVTRVLAETGSR